MLLQIFEKNKFIIHFFNNPFAPGCFSLMPLSFSFVFGPRGHLTDYLPTLRGQSWTFD